MLNNDSDVTVSLSMTMFLLSVVTLLSFMALGFAIMYKKLKELKEETQRERNLLRKLLKENSIRTINFSGQGYWLSRIGNSKGAFGRNVDQNATDHKGENHTEINDLTENFDTDQLMELSIPTGRIHKHENSRDFVGDTSDEDDNRDHVALKTHDAATEWNIKILGSFDMSPCVMRVVHRPGLFFHFFFGIIETYSMKVLWDDGWQVSIQIVYLELFVFILGLQMLISLTGTLFCVRARYQRLSPKRIEESLTCLVFGSTRQKVQMYNFEMQNTSKFLPSGDTCVILDIWDKHWKIEATLNELTSFDKRLYKKVL